MLKTISRVVDHVLNGPPKVPKAPLISVKSGHPLQRVAIDIVGPTPRSSSGHEWLLVVSDHLTKFAQAFPVRNTSAVTLALCVCQRSVCASVLRCECKEFSLSFTIHTHSLKITEEKVLPL